MLFVEKWKSEKVPSVNKWHKKCQHGLLMNPLTAINKGREDQINAIKSIYRNTGTMYRLLEYCKTAI